MAYENSYCEGALHIRVKTEWQYKFVLQTVCSERDSSIVVCTLYRHYVVKGPENSPYEGN